MALDFFRKIWKIMKGPWMKRLIGKSMYKSDWSMIFSSRTIQESESSWRHQSTTWQSGPGGVSARVFSSCPKLFSWYGASFFLLEWGSWAVVTWNSLEGAGSCFRSFFMIYSYQMYSQELVSLRFNFDTLLHIVCVMPLSQQTDLCCLSNCFYVCRCASSSKQMKPT